MMRICGFLSVFRNLAREKMTSTFFFKSNDPDLLIGLADFFFYFGVNCGRHSGWLGPQDLGEKKIVETTDAYSI